MGQNFYPKIASNKWWDKYKGEENVLIEDMDTTHAYQGYYLKIWADKYAFPVEVKNGADWIRPKIIIVTSNYTIEQVFPDPAIHKPLLERFKVIHKDKRWNATAFTELMNVEDSFEDEKKDSVYQQRTNGKVFKSKPLKKKSRKYDKPLKKPALFRQNADGDIVPNHEKQVLMEESLALKEAQLIAREEDEENGAPILEDDIEKEVLDIESTNPYNNDYVELCYLCGNDYDNCNCMKSDEDEVIDLTDNDYIYDGNDEFGSDDCSEDLFDI